MSYFELRTARDMLEKARRERQRLHERFDIDNVFNFFVTAYHIYDYVCWTRPDLRDTVRAFRDQNQDITACRDLCDKGKHLVLTKRPDPSTHILKHRIGEAPLGVLRVGSGRTTWCLHINNRWVEVERLTDRVLEKWESFFSDNNL